MGVDIYGYAERALGDCWQFTGELVTNTEREYDPEAPEWMPKEVFHSSIKELAAILTGSGNPIRSSEPYIPVVPQRGLPVDLSPELNAWLRRYQDDVSAACTWFTCREATDFAWRSRLMRRRAYVPLEAAPLFAGCPRGFPLAHWPVGVPIKYAEWSRDGVEVEWVESYEEIVTEFVHEVLPQLTSLGQPDQVRLVVLAGW